MIDLHTHTNSSDGTLSLAELVRRAESAGLSAIAITDHDTVQSAREIARLQSKIEVIPGIEFSVYDNKLDYIDIHVLGLFIGPENEKLHSRLSALEIERENQKKSIIKKLNELGFIITFEDAKKFATGSIGRPHIARALIEKYPEEFHSISECFDKLLDQGKPAFKTRSAFFCLDECIDLIHGAGGLAFLAHPGFYKYDLEKLLADFKRLGGDGIESVYDYVSNAGARKFNEEDNIMLRKQLQQAAKEMGFLESGGSDYHAPNKGAKLGGLGVPDNFLKKMKMQLHKRKL